MLATSPLTSLSQYGLMQPSIKNVSIYSTISLLILVSLLHALAILARSEVLDIYTTDHFSKAEQVAFQIEKGLELSQVDKGEPCSDADISQLRAIKKTYFFIGDIGRVSNNQMICTALNGKLASPMTLPARQSLASNGYEYRNSQTGFIHYNNNNPPIVSYQDAAAFPSQAYIQLTERFFSSIDGMAGVIYLEADKRYIHSYFGQVVPKEFDAIIAHKNTILNWLPIPNQIRSKRKCNHAFNVCITAIDKNLGMYSWSTKTLSFIIPVLALIAIAFGFMIEHFRVGPRALTRKLKKVIQQNQITPVYQPQVSLATQEIVGVESLARWHDPILGDVSPELFIRVAEESNLVELLTQKLMTSIFQELHETLASNTAFTVSINIPTELLTSDRFVNFLNTLTATYTFNRNQVVIEVTERSTSDQHEMASFSKRLKAQGYLVSVDDFGTGASNLSWLSTLEPNEIKVDKIFTHAIGTETVNSITLGGIFRMLEHLSVKAVFEGIETEAQRDYIQQKLPNAYGQGGLFAKPLKIADLLALLKADAP